MQRRHTPAPIGRAVSRLAPLTIGFFSLWLTGCAAYQHSQDNVERAVQDWQRRRASVAQSPAAALPPNAISLDDAATDANRRPVERYISEAMERHPGIKAAIANVRAKLARIPQVTALPDPILRVIIRPEPIQTAAGDMYATLGAAQRIPMLAKLERAGDIAAAETRIAIERLNAKRLQIIADVERAYWRIYRLDRYIELTQQNRRLLEDLEGVIDTQYQVGKVPQQDLLRVQTELAKLRDDEARYRLQRAAAVAAINQLADRPPRREIPKTTPVDVPVVRSDAESLIALASEYSPELAALRQQAERDREGVALADLGYWPDITIGAEWSYLEPRDPFIPPVNPATNRRPAFSQKSDVGDDNWAITLQLNVPIWSQRVEAAKREARHRLEMTRSELRAAETMVAFRIVDAWSRVKAQENTLRVLRTELLPQSRQTYEVTLAAYQSGEAGFLSLIEDWRRWLQFELMRCRETVDLETAFADLQREVGMQLLRQQSVSAARIGDANDEQ